MHESKSKEVYSANCFWNSVSLYLLVSRNRFYKWGEQSFLELKPKGETVIIKLGKTQVKSHGCTVTGVDRSAFLKY